MVHLRLNDSDTSRNKHINYITALPRYANTDQAHHRLQQLAAQVQPVMKQHGFQINSLEEFEWNREFAGRNWNNGETVELVLRRQDGSFAPLQWVLMVFCHELAHIKYMNHIPSQHGKLDRELRNECRELQARGYYGDGFWSAGQRLEDNAFVAGSGISSLQGLPEYSCGGAYRSKSSKGRSVKRRRTGANTRSRGRGFKGPSLHTGAQTAPNTKGGRRVQASLPGRGSRVDGNNHIPTASASSASYRDDANSTFRKRTQTASARELRAQAALRRLTATKSEDIDIKPAPGLDSFWPQNPDPGSPATSGSGSDRVKEEDGEGTEDESDTEDEDDEDSKEGGLVIRLDDSSSDEADRHMKGPSGASSSSNDGTVRVKQEPDHSTIASTESQQQRLDRSRLYRQHQLKQGGTLRSTSEDWQDFCSIASLPTGHSTATSGPSAARSPTTLLNSKDDPIELVSSDEEDVKPAAAPKREPKKDASDSSSRKGKWSCQVCTLLNSPNALRCDACLATKGSFLVGQ
ncbi:hypothetical protein PHSY_007374 [Pseudozyma hubeiensis SY62]|uniref:WLM-domain-containing protein n=1 Tax=Pseudozyma hubeiensis (strain SY62) TaxID=1305764 RepID=R9PEJ2_PSEHS|nr:hypothetical protein PHSY_007374 [Pseudozyma hubeiensis SY62]GAC99771.1 hypothetical protein PHSY_007374 [Pseudozyma hubeiensis SY62]